MLLQVLPLKLTEGFALTILKFLAKEVFMREVHYEMAAKYIPCILLNNEYTTPVCSWRHLFSATFVQQAPIAGVHCTLSADVVRAI